MKPIPYLCGLLALIVASCPATSLANSAGEIAYAKLPSPTPANLLSLELPYNQGLLTMTAIESVERVLKFYPDVKISALANTRSMKPLLDESFVVLVERAPIEKLSMSEIVAFIAVDTIKMHRIVGKAGFLAPLDAPAVSGRFPVFFTSGDNSEGHVDQTPTTPDNYVGKAIAAVHIKTGKIIDLRHQERQVKPNRIYKGDPFEFRPAKTYEKDFLATP